MTTSGLLNRKIIVFTIDDKSMTLPQAREIIVGRFAPTDSVQPDLDLGPFDAEHKGVSRRHVRISYNEAQFWLVDLSSMNGTWLNGSSLKPLLEYPLRDGDNLRLGSLEIGVKFGATAFLRSQSVP